MSVEAMNWVLVKAPINNPTELAVLIGLASHAQRDGSCSWPAIPTLAGYARISERTVQRTLRDMEERKVIVRGEQRANEWKFRGGYRPVVYDLPLEPEDYLRPDELTALNEIRGDKLSPRERLSHIARGDTGGHRGVTTVADEPSIEPSYRVRSHGERGDNETASNESSTTKTKSRGALRSVPAEDHGDDAAIVGVRSDTQRARTARERVQMRNTESPAGLAAEFAVRCRDAGITGPQQINAAALGRNFRTWLDQGDAPDKVREMFDRWFEQVQPDSTACAWRDFVREGPKLRARVTPREEYDYAAARERENEQIRRDAAAGDKRAQAVLDGTDKPWLNYKPKTQRFKRRSG